MRVRVNKPRHNDTSTGIESRLIWIRGFELIGCAHSNDRFIANNDGSVFDDAKRAEAFAALRSAGKGEELGGGVDEHGDN